MASFVSISAYSESVWWVTELAPPIPGALGLMLPFLFTQGCVTNEGSFQCQLIDSCIASILLTTELTLTPLNPFIWHGKFSCLNFLKNTSIKKSQDQLSFSPTVMWTGLYKVTRPLNGKQTAYNIMTLSLSALRGTRSAPGFCGVTRLWSLGQ